MNDFAMSSGFPEVGASIDLPDYGYLLTNPMFAMAPLAFFMDKSSNFQKHLISKAPLERTKKNIYVTSNMTYIFPNYSPTSNRLGNTFEWHIDGSGSLHNKLVNKDSGDILHAFCGGEATTVFNEEEIALDFSGCDGDIFKFVESINKEGFIKKYRSAEKNSWIKFDSGTIHRAPSVDKVQFRFFMGVIESDNEYNIHPSKWIPRHSELFRGNESFKNIEHKGHEIIIHLLEEGQ